jgi:hypothetical protein
MYASPGESVRETSRRLYEQAGRKALVAAALLALATAIGARGGGGVGAILIAAGLLVANEARGRARSARGFKIGAIAEERVGARLGALEEWGWVVEHDVQKRGGGNVDHVVHAAGVTFVIDTKASRWRYRDLAQAHRHADWAARRYGGGREIVPVVCVQGADLPARLFDGVFVVGAARLTDFLCDWE